jgi:hypothetical protein
MEQKARSIVDDQQVVGNWMALNDPEARLGGVHPHYSLRLTSLLTVNLDAGMRMKIRDCGNGTHFFIVTGVGHDAERSTIFMYGGNVKAVMQPGPIGIYYSFVKCPAGFPTNERRWTMYSSSYKAKTSSADSLRPLQARRKLTFRRAVKLICSHYGSPSAAAHALRLTTRTWQRWEAGDVPSSFTKDRLVEHAQLILLDMEVLDVAQLESEDGPFGDAG